MGRLAKPSRPRNCPLVIALGPAFDLTRPWALWGLLLAVPIVLLHLYFRRRKRQTVAFLPLFRESLIQTKDLRRWRRLRDTMTLVARLGALACFVLALAGIRPITSKSVPEALALVIDADITTRAIENDDRSRYRHALDRARAWVDAQPAVGGQNRFAAPVLAVLAHAPCRVCMGPTRDRGDALRELDKLANDEPASLTTSIRAATSLANTWLTKQERGRLVVLTSRSIDDAGDMRPVPRVVEGIGIARNDAGIEDLSWQRDTENWKDQLDVRVAYFGTTSASFKVGAYAGEKALIERTVAFDAPGRQRLELSFDPPDEEQWVDVRVALENDCFSSNDVVSYYSPAPRRPSLLIVQDGRPRWFVAAARDALIEGKEIDLAMSGSVSPEKLARAAPRTVALIDGVPLPNEALRPGAYIFLAPFSGALPFEVGRDVQAPLVWRTDADHPLMFGLDFTRTFAAKATTLHGKGLRALAYAEGQPVIAEGERDGTRYAALGIHPEKSLLPMRAALPLWIRKAVDRLGVTDRAPFRPLYKTGDVVRPEVDIGFADARIETVAPGMNPNPSALRAVLSAESAWRIPVGLRGKFQARVSDRAFPFGVLEVDPHRTVVPTRPTTAMPGPASPAPASRAKLWRRLLLGAGLTLLVLDLLLTITGLRRERRLRMRVAAA